jgi:hypothetical protein
METKICKKCRVEKNTCEYNKDKYSADGLRYRCKECTSKEYRKYYDLNRESEINRQVNYQKNNSQFVNDKRAIRHRKKYNNDILYRLKLNVRNRVKLFIKSSNFDIITNGTFKFVGCTPKELKDYIEKQFTEGMTWENYGYDGWHIDHKIPLSSAKTIDEVYELSKYTNLQPLWSKDNYKKGKKIL